MFVRDVHILPNVLVRGAVLVSEASEAVLVSKTSEAVLVSEVSEAVLVSEASDAVLASEGERGRLGERAFGDCLRFRTCRVRVLRRG